MGLPDFAFFLCAVETPSSWGAFGNSIRYGLRNHGTSDGRTWTSARAVGCRVQWATLQTRSRAVNEVHKGSNYKKGLIRGPPQNVKVDDLISKVDDLISKLTT